MNSIERLQSALKAEAKQAQQDVAAALEALARSHALRITGPHGSTEHALALAALAEALSRLQAAADLSGRLEVRFPSSKAPVPEQFASSSDPYSRTYARTLGKRGEVSLARELPAAVFGERVVADSVPVVVFAEAVRDLEERNPVGAAELKRAGLEVEDVYGALQTPEGLYYPHGFALARAADVEVAAAVRERLIAGMSRGTPTPEVVEELTTTWEWPRAYAETVVRTNFNTATTAGRFLEAERVNASGIHVGLRFETAGDSNVRAGHKALDGLVARVDDPVWDRWSPPGGFNCRCVAVPVIGDDVPISFVAVPTGAVFAPGFGRRPSRSGAYSG